MKVFDIRGKAWIYYNDNFMSIAEAHELMSDLAEAIGVAVGHQERLDGKIPDNVDCPHCGARRMTATHVCKRTKVRTR